jgi:alkylglycerol monooxygenase
VPASTPEGAMIQKLFLIAGLSYIASVLIELAYTRWKKLPYYRFHRTLDSLGSALGNLAVSSVLRIGPLLAYALAEEHLALFRLPEDSWLVWAAALLLTDLGFYLYHRATHRVNLLWAVHQVHHQSEDYNLATAMRSPWLQGVVSTINFLPIALLGIPFEVFGVVYLIGVSYGFIIHTRLVGRLGFLEYILVTPSAHRVHHGAEARYVDKNFGGVFIFWDMLFGTYQREEEEPSYGLGGEARTYNPAASNLYPLADLYRAARRAGSIGGALSALFGPPGPPPAPTRPAAPALSARSRRLSLALLVLAILQSIGIILAQKHAPFWVNLILSAGALSALYGYGRLLDGPRVKAAE